MEQLRAAVALLADAGPSQAKALALVALGGLLMVSADQGALDVCRRALDVAEELGTEELRMRARNYLGFARIDEGDLGGLDDLEHSAAVARKNNFVYSPVVIQNLGDALVDMGRLEEGFAIQSESRDRARQLGIAKMMWWSGSNTVSECFWTGQWAAAEALADKLITAPPNAGSRHYLEPRCRVVRGAIRLARGDIAGAVEDAALAIADCRNADDPQLLYPSLAFGARASSPWIAAAAALARGEFGDAADRYATIGSLPDEAFARLLAAQQLAAAGHRTEADAQLARAVGFYREVGATAYLRRGEALFASSA